MRVVMKVVFDREDVKKILKEAYFAKFGPAPEGFTLECDCQKYDTIPPIIVETVAIPTPAPAEQF